MDTAFRLDAAASSRMPRVTASGAGTPVAALRPSAETDTMTDPDWIGGCGAASRGHV